jgi:hypothetical protein
MSFGHGAYLIAAPDLPSWALVCSGKRCPLVLTIDRSSSVLSAVDTGLWEELCVIVVASRRSATSEQPKSATTDQLDGGALLLGEHTHRPMDPLQRRRGTRDRPAPHRTAAPPHFLLSCGMWRKCEIRIRVGGALRRDFVPPRVALDRWSMMNG